MWRKLCVLVLAVAASGSALAGQARWEQELRQMGYMFLHMSNINVINGLNLTREQAAKLHRLARQVEAVAQRPPSFKARLSPELQEVRQTWLEARALILKGEPVPEELERRVTQSRAVESRVIRTTLRSRPTAWSTRCSACHTAPQAGTSQPMSVTARVKPLADRAHMEGIYGKRGLVKMVMLSNQVKSILTDAQKAILGSFACCLVPPQDLSNPMRAGQAEGSEKAIALMRKVRDCPDGFWPVLRGAILKKVDQITDAVSPGANAARKTATRERIAKTLDRVRKLNDVEFAMDREKLAKTLKAAILPTQRDSAHKAAYFLLIPGSSRVYANYIRRLGRRQRAAASPGAARTRRD